MYGLEAWLHGIKCENLPEVVWDAAPKYTPVPAHCCATALQGSVAALRIVMSVLLPWCFLADQACVEGIRVSLAVPAAGAVRQEVVTLPAVKDVVAVSPL